MKVFIWALLAVVSVAVGQCDSDCVIAEHCGLSRHGDGGCFQRAVQKCDACRVAHSMAPIGRRRYESVESLLQAQPKVSSNGDCDMRSRIPWQKTRCPAGQICVAKIPEITDGPGICALKEVECVKDSDCPQTSKCRTNIRPAGDGAACKDGKSCGLCIAP